MSQLQSRRHLGTKGRRLLWIGTLPDSFGNEPERLRKLGYEVVVVHEGSAQVTALGADDLAVALAFDPAYPVIGPEHAALLNACFDAVIVSNSPRWTDEILRVFDRRIIARSHGSAQSLGDELWHLGSCHIMLRRRDYHRAIHAPHVAIGDHYPPSGGNVVIPGWLDEDILALKDTWAARDTLGEPRSGPAQAEILVSAPVDRSDAYHSAYRAFITTHFNQAGYSILPHIGTGAPEMAPMRAARLARMRRCAGYAYAFTDSTQIHMAPFEMMTLGGPVIYFSASALAAQMPPRSPGEARTVEEAHVKCRALREGDKGLVAEILAAQADIRGKLSPAVAGPAFDAAFDRLLTGPEFDRPGIAASGITYQPPREALQVMRMLRSLAYRAAPGGPAPMWTSEETVRCFYHLILDREPDESGLRVNVEALNNGMAPATLLASFLNSAEALSDPKRSRFLQWLDV